MEDMDKTLCQWFLEEIENESRATRACIERFREDLSDWKPHERSMKMGQLALLLADMPRWITYAIQQEEIDFATFPQMRAVTTEEMLALFDKNMKDAREALEGCDDKKLDEDFFLKSGGKELMKDTKKNTVGMTINHLAHHRGQYTVYLRLNNIPVPSIYGPSGDDTTWAPDYSS